MFTYFLADSLHNRQMGILQTGQETDFILVSCTGSGVEPTRREQVLKAKRVYLFSHLFLLANPPLFSVLYKCIELLAFRLGKIHWEDQALVTQLFVPVPSRYSFCSMVKLIIWSTVILYFFLKRRQASLLITNSRYKIIIRWE